MATFVTTRFQLEGADGGPLRGEVRTSAAGRERPAVVICHGFKGFKDWGFFPYLAERLARAGFTAVTFNFSGSGVGPDGRFTEPERFARNTHTLELADLSRVLETLTDGGLPGTAAPVALGLFGHSRGGAAALVHAVENDSVRSLVTWSAIGTVRRWADDSIQKWENGEAIEIVNQRTGDVLPLGPDLWKDIEQNRERLDLTAAARRLTAPWLVVHGMADEAVPVEEARQLKRAAGDTAELMLLEGAGHTLGAKHPWGGPSPELNTALDATVEHYSRDLFPVA